MDTWSRDVRRSKRSFGDISQSTLITPPISLGDPESTTSFTEQVNLGSLFVGRQSSRRYQNNSTIVQQQMAQQTQSQTSHRQDSLPSQTVIDLTNDVEHIATERRAPEVRGRSRATQLPGPSITVSTGDFVDLTGDQEQNESDEVIFTGQRTVVLRQNIQHSGPRTSHGNRPQRGLRSTSPSLFLPSRSVLPVVSSGYRFTAVRNNDGRLAVDLTSLGQMFPPHSMDNLSTFWHLGAIQNIASHLDYANQSYDRAHDHVPPPSARSNFTRSPTATDILICPSCEEELVHYKEDVIIRKGNKTTTKKDKEEHPFWVVKECGHVFCNKCYQNRADKIRTTGFCDGIKPSNTKSNTRKYLVCAVDDCKSDVRAQRRRRCNGEKDLAFYTDLTRLYHSKRSNR